MGEVSACWMAAEAAMGDFHTLGKSETETWAPGVETTD